MIWDKYTISVETGLYYRSNIAGFQSPDNHRYIPCNFQDRSPVLFTAWWTERISNWDIWGIAGNRISDQQTSIFIFRTHTIWNDLTVPLWNIEEPHYFQISLKEHMWDKMIDPHKMPPLAYLLTTLCVFVLYYFEFYV